MADDICLGYYSGIPAYVDPEALNHHIFISGTSGAGKTTLMERIAANLSVQGATSLVLSINGSFDNLSDYYSEPINRGRKDIYLRKEGLPLPLFTPTVSPDGEVEALEDVCAAIVDTFARAMKLGSRQRTNLSRAVEVVMNTGLYHEHGLNALGYVLSSDESAIAASLYERMKAIFRLIHDGEGLITRGHTTIVHLTGLSLGVQALILDFVLSYVWRLSTSGCFLSSPLYLFLDECHNAASGKNSPMAAILREGRRLNLNAVTSTQALLKGHTSAVQELLSLCAVQLYLRPVLSALSQTAASIDPENKVNWKRRLARLERGEFVAMSGGIKVGDDPVSVPLVVTSSIDKIRGYDQCFGVFRSSLHRKSPGR